MACRKCSSVTPIIPQMLIFYNCLLIQVSALQIYEPNIQKSHRLSENHHDCSLPDGMRGVSRNNSRERSGCCGNRERGKRNNSLDIGKLLSRDIHGRHRAKRRHLCLRSRGWSGNALYNEQLRSDKGLKQIRSRHCPRA